MWPQRPDCGTLVSITPVCPGPNQRAARYHTATAPPAGAATPRPGLFSPSPPPRHPRSPPPPRAAPTPRRSEYPRLPGRPVAVDALPNRLARQTQGDRPSPSWMQVVPDTLQVLIHQLPVRQQIDTILTEQLIVELYSKN